MESGGTKEMCGGLGEMAEEWHWKKGGKEGGRRKRRKRVSEAVGGVGTGGVDSLIRY